MSQEQLAMLASPHRSSADAGSRGRLFSSSCEERPAGSWHRSLSRSRHDGREHVVVLAVVVPEGELTRERGKEEEGHFPGVFSFVGHPCLGPLAGARDGPSPMRSFFRSLRERCCNLIHI